MRDLRGKTALVTGASRGIGPYIVRALAEHGMHLVLSARATASLDSVATAARARGVRVTCIAADLSDRADIHRLAEQTEIESGGIAVLVNNAGVESAHAFDTVDVASLDHVIAVNLTAPMVLTRLLLPAMLRRGEGHVVNIASLAGLSGAPYEEAYSATKHGIVGFSRSLRMSMRAEGHPIGVSVVCPGFVAGAGMYENAKNATGGSAPFLLGTVPVEKVSRAVVRAIVRAEAEIVLSVKPIIPFLLLQTVAPGLVGRVSLAAGVGRTFKRWSQGTAST
jgi:short-subunit dehydrogenase